MEVKSLSNPPAGVKTVMEVSICEVILLVYMCPCNHLQNICVSDDIVMSRLRRIQQLFLLLLYNPAIRHLKRLHKQAPPAALLRQSLEMLELQMALSHVC